MKKKTIMYYDSLVKAVIENNVKLVIELLDNNITEIKSVMTNIKLYYLFYKIKSKEIFTVLLSYFDDKNIFDLSNILTSIVNVAIIIGMDIEMIQRLVERGAYINLTDVQGISPLLQSIKSRRDLNFIENILKMGANVNQIFDENNTILHIVVSNFNQDDNHLKIVKLLIDYGANINSKNYSGEIPLMKAISHTNEDIWFELIDRGTNITETEKNHEFVSILACALSIKNRSIELIHKLVTSGADVNAINTEGHAPIYVALKNNYSLEYIVNLINYGADVNYVNDPDRITPLLLAIMLKRSKEIVLALINSCANVNVKFVGKTPLMYTLDNEYDIEIIRKLIKMGANINEQDDIGVTSLMRAMKTNNKDIISLLINSGADVSLIDGSGKTALFYALIYNNNKQIIKLLIDNGADVNRINECYNHTWFGVNVIKTNNQDNVFIELIYNKKNYNEKDDSGKTFLMYSIELNKNTDVILDIINSGSDVNAVDNNGFTPLIYSILHNSDHDVIINLIEHGADVNYCDKEGNTLLCYVLDCAIQNFDDSYSTKSNDLIKLLINYGFDINACDRTGKTILMDVLNFIYDKEFINFLIEKGANINAKSKSGLTPLMCAALNHFGGPDIDIITLLVDNNAEVDAIDVNGRTALFYIISHKLFDCSKVFNLLFDRGASINKCISGLDCGYTSLVNHTYMVPNVEILIELLHCKPDITGIDYFGHSFLFCLVRLYKYKELARILIYDNINILLKDPQQIICIFSNMYDTGLFKTFFQFGIDINYADNKGRTPLMQAVINCRDCKFIKAIIDNGGNPKCLDNDLNTPLHFAQSVDVVNILILYGNNDVSAKNIYNKTPLQCVEEPFETLSYLLEIIKHLVLISSEEVNDNPEIRYCNYFINECKKEVDKMKYQYFIDNISFYKLYFKLSNYEKSLISKSNLNDSEIKQCFPIYYNIIIMLINKYKKYYLKIKLRNNLERLLIISNNSVNSKNFSENYQNCEGNENSRLLSEYFSLDFDSLNYLSKYLNLGQIINLYLASIE